MTTITSSYHQNNDGGAFYSNYHKGAHPILNTRDALEKVFPPLDTYLETEQSVNLDNKITRIFILRHTESLANSLGINAGRMDFSLSIKGHKDADMLGEQLSKQMKSLKIDAVYCTNLKRTSETYQDLNAGWKRFQAEGLPEPRIVEELTERDNGELEGKPKEEYEPYKKEESKVLDTIKEFDELFDYKIPKGGTKYESLHDIWDRAVPALNKIAQDNQGKNVLVISHVGVMRALIEGCAAAKDDPVTMHYRNYDIKNGSMLAFKSDGNGIRLEASSPFDFEKNKK